MSAERDSVLKRIDNYDTELLEVKKNLLKENDPEKKAELIKRRDLLEGTIATMEKRALALTTQQTGTSYLSCYRVASGYDSNRRSSCL